MTDSYVVEFVNENEYRKKERSVKKYNMLAYKKLLFEYYPNFRKGIFSGEIKNKQDDGVTFYVLTLPTDTMFRKVHGDIMLHYRVHPKEKIVVLETLMPEDLLTEGHNSELTTYKGVMVSKSHTEKDMFKINLLNMINK